MNWSEVKYFGRGEFDDPDYPDSGELINEELVKKLDLLRELSGWAIIPHWKVGGCVDVKGTHGHSERSYHRKERGCKACDFHFADPKTFEPLDWPKAKDKNYYFSQNRIIGEVEKNEK